MDNQVNLCCFSLVNIHLEALILVFTFMKIINYFTLKKTDLKQVFLGKFFMRQI